MSVDAVPAMIQMGHAAIAVQWDVWGLAYLAKGTVDKARAMALELAPAKEQQDVQGAGEEQPDVQGTKQQNGSA